MISGKHKVTVFLLLTVLPILAYSVGPWETPLETIDLGIIQTDKPVIKAIGLTVGDILTTISLMAGALAIWHFYLKKRI